MYSLAAPLKRKEMRLFADTLQIGGYDIHRSESVVTAYREGVKHVSAVSVTGAKWSVQVSEEVAINFKLKLWRVAV